MFSESVNLGISLCIIVIISIFQVPKYFADKIIDFISLAGNPLVQFLLAFLIIVLLVIGSKYAKEVEKFFKISRKNREKMKDEMDKFESELHAKKLKSFSEAIDEGLKK